MDWIAISLQLLASAMSLAGLWKIGDKSIWGPAIALAAQVPWLILTFYCGLWGLLPADVIFTVVFVRNFIKWHREAQPLEGNLEEFRRGAEKALCWNKDKGNTA